MVFRGILEKSFGTFLCLRGFCSLADLARCSIPDKNYQRPKLDDHINEIVGFFNDANNLFFPEVILGVSLDECGVSEDEYNWFYREAVNGNGVARKKLGNLTVSIFAKKFLKEGGGMIVHNTMSVYGFGAANDSTRLYRIDGNHRLEAALSEKVNPEVLDRYVPYCIVFFRDRIKYKENASTIFRNINFKVRPILEEYNLRIVLDDDVVFTNALLKENPAYGRHFVWVRNLLHYLKDHKSNILASAYMDSICTFLMKIFEIVASRKIVGGWAKDDPPIKELASLVGLMEAALSEERIAKFVCIQPIAESLIYYKIQSDNTSRSKRTSEYDDFCSWLLKNNFSRIKRIEAKEIVAIFDEIYKSIPRQLFLARWYPQKGEEKRKADARYAAMERLAKGLNLQLIDMEHEKGGTFSIRDMIDQKLPGSDLFVADLTGARPNVMIEVGMALHHIKHNRVLFYFQRSDEAQSVPFDISGFKYEEIVDSSEIESKLAPRIKEILSSLL